VTAPLGEYGATGVVGFDLVVIATPIPVGSVGSRLLTGGRT
jgi:hypothetical protein